MSKINGAPRMDVSLGSLKLKNPVLTASGTSGYGDELGPFLDVGMLGGFVCKSLSLKPREGNPPPRLAETPSGMLNSIGLQNIGVDAFIKDKLPILRSCKATVIASIFGHTIEEFGELAERLDGQEGVAALELNISCPNTDSGGVEFGIVPELTRKVTEAVRRKTKLPVIVKLSPNVTDITVLARAALDGGGDILSLVNTFFGMAINVEWRKPVISSGTGGLSGPAIKPMAVHLVRKVACAVDAPIIGIGGISTAADALEFILAGATAIQVGTATFVNPGATMKILEGMEDYCRRHEVAALSELVGAVQDQGKRKSSSGG
jgi:dihydroorotate dehydrogenase (NAD+) catalytic subunit